MLRLHLQKSNFNSELKIDCEIVFKKMDLYGMLKTAKCKNDDDDHNILIAIIC